jgi:hypothetical protein
MPKLLIVEDSGACGQGTLRKYPSVSSPDGSITVTPIVGADGGTTYQVAVTHDINVANASYDAASTILTLTETDGEVHTVNLGTLVSTVDNTLPSGHLIAVHTANGQAVDILETVTNMTRSGATIQYVNEAGQTLSIPVCDLLTSIADNGTIVGG